MAEWGGGSLARGAVDNYPRKMVPPKISLRIPRVNQILGTSIAGREIQQYLQNLELGVEPQGADAFGVTPPTFRVDLQREIDLIEEVARLQGFGQIPVTLPSGKVSAEKKTRGQRAAERARNLLSAFGFWEVITYSFIAPKVLQDLKLPPADKRAKALRIHNPLGEDQSVMRTTLIPGLLQAVGHNVHRQNLDLKLFELGRIFFPQEGQDLPEEMEAISGVLTGLREEETWSKPKAECDFFDLKGALETLLDGLGVTGYRFLPERDEPFLHPGKACRVEVNKRSLGSMGEAHPDVGAAFEIDQKLFLFELNFQNLVEGGKESRSFKPLRRFPSVTRDLALIVDEKIKAGDILHTLWEANSGLIAEIKIFDLYRGKPIPPGGKSLAFRIKYQRDDRTLTDAEVNEFHQKMIELLANRYGAVLR
jgi:phenylalanyl-tRNA synthetase beta chain